MRTTITVKLQDSSVFVDDDIENETEVTFVHRGGMTFEDLMDYFIRAALAFSYQRGSIDDVIVGLADGLREKETEDEELTHKPPSEN